MTKCNIRAYISSCRVANKRSIVHSKRFGRFIFSFRDLVHLFFAFTQFKMHLGSISISEGWLGPMDCIVLYSIGVTIAKNVLVRMSIRFNRDDEQVWLDMIWRIKVTWRRGGGGNRREYRKNRLEKMKQRLRSTLKICRWKKRVLHAHKCTYTHYI